ncbi:apolipoprotein N-acyltransferase [Treponema primitia ZAS-2]|uniref:Apolipoprotein N-acyltransferase n=1 Tax=Treponema primitia (strain ATCC BAA-887 / DSM 12427 / ZAS-2) TaxID=545694 RepID=F5YKI7_TREPZ|nr:apolipoprotein N-acyltransferase [Treponema primitia]AEF83562.1 apolipoprotein N-acyltransferase [Treponema primitia ZAS-2]
MSSLKGARNWKGFPVQIALILLGALLFAGSFPNPIAINGLSFLGWIAFVPVFWVIYQVSLPASIFFGALYGYAAYGLFNYWLSVFHPLAGLIVGSIYLVYFAILFPLLKLATILFPRKGYIVQWILWIAYEFLRTQGFLGYPYGITGYSQWQVLPVIRIAAIFGVWGVSALVVFPSVYIAGALRDRQPLGTPRGGFIRPLRAFLSQEWAAALVWVIALTATLVYGFVSPVDYSAAPKAHVALIQHNTDPWRGGITEYRKNFDTLRRLSLEALDAAPETDLVVWSETAFVPRIFWHTMYRDDPESFLLVRDLMDFLATQEVPYVIGNDDARRELNAQGILERVDYNGVMLFEGNTINQIYRKLHLVPFTEHFPYQKQLPWIYDMLEKADTHFWKEGEEATVFESRGLKFSTPICFEDIFGYLSRDFVRNGAELIVNLSNDAWSKSVPAQMQHLSMAVFRAVENRRSMVRSTASGQTCAIDPYGKVLAMAEPFTEAWINVEVPVISPNTPYTFWGDIWGKLFVLAAAFMLILGALRGIMRKGRN